MSKTKSAERGARFVRFYPSDWRSGCIGLSLEEEGFYVRVCAHFYETGQRLPLDDLEASSRLMTDVRMYRRLKNKLIAKGKLYAQEDGYSVPRAERELALARSAAEGGAQADVVTARDTPRAARPNRGTALEGQPADVPSTIELPSDFAETSAASVLEVCQETQQILRATKEPEPERKREVQNPPNPQTGERDDMPRHVKTVQNWGSAFAPPEPEPQVGLIGDRLVLAGETRSRWLALFGGDEAALGLVLIEVRGQVQPHSRSHSLAAQVERHLARIVRDRAERDRRYREATAASAARRPTASAAPSGLRPDGKPTMAEIVRRRREAAEAAEAEVAA